MKIRIQGFCWVCLTLTKSGGKERVMWCKSWRSTPLTEIASLQTRQHPSRIMSGLQHTTTSKASIKRKYSEFKQGVSKKDDLPVEKEETPQDVAGRIMEMFKFDHSKECWRCRILSLAVIGFADCWKLLLILGTVSTRSV